MKPEEQKPLLIIEENFQPKNRDTTSEKSIVPTATRKKLETACDYAGAVITAAALLPQGFFGGLYTFIKFPNMNIIVRIGLSGVIAVTAWRGKERLVRFYGRESFINLAKPIDWEKIQKDSTLAHITFQALNYFFTAVGSGVFGYLAVASCDQSAAMLRTFENTATNTAADIVSHSGFKAPFIACAIGSNLLSLSTINKFAKDSALNTFYKMLANPEFLKQKYLLQNQVEAARLEWRRICLAKKDRGFLKDNREFLELFIEQQHKLADTAKLGHIFLKTKPEKLLNIILDLSKQGRFDTLLPKPVSWTETSLKLFLGLTLSGVGTLGLYNFVRMTTNGAQLIGITNPAVQTFLSWVDYATMGMLAYNSINSLTTSLLDFIFSRNPQLNLHSKKSQAATIILTLVVCALGGSPNADQSLLAGLGIFWQVAAFAASFLIEVQGYHALNVVNDNNKLSAKSPLAAFFMQIDAKLLDVIKHVESFSAEQLNSVINPVGSLSSEQSSGMENANAPTITKEYRSTVEKFISYIPYAAKQAYYTPLFYKPKPEANATSSVNPAKPPEPWSFTKSARQIPELFRKTFGLGDKSNTERQPLLVPTPRTS